MDIGERNLAPERGPNVWDREGASAPSASRGRWLVGLGGAAIALAGAALAAVGGTMIYRATVGHEGEEAGQPDIAPAPGTTRRDIVADESAASVPASDAPSWTPTVGAVPDKIQ